MALTSSALALRLPLGGAPHPHSTALPHPPVSTAPHYAASSSSESCDGGREGGRHRSTRTICLSRRRLSVALGFAVRGGKEHGTGFFVSSVDAGSEADARGLRAGDQIIRINGFPVEDATHREVLQLIQGQMNITLKVRSVGMIPVKDSYNDSLTWKLVDSVPSSECSLALMPPSSLTSSSSQSVVCSEDPHPLQSHNEARIVLHVAPRAKLGCGICKGPEWRPGIFVQFTKENGLARGAGLRPGDQILKCNNITFTPDTPFNEAVSVLRSSGLLELQVRKGAGLDLFPGESSGYNSSASSVAGDQSPETWLNKRLSIVKEESVIDSESRLSHNDLNRNYMDRKEVGLLTHSSVPSSSNKSTNTDNNNIGTCTVIRVGSDEPTTIDSSRRTDSTTDSHKNKLAEICMVSQQTETKTTTVLVEVHQSEEESAGSKTEKSGLMNSSSLSSFTSTSSNSNSLSSAISQELQRRSQRRASDTIEVSKSVDGQGAAGGVGGGGGRREVEMVRNGLDKEKVQQHEQLMEEFRRAHRRMFSNTTTTSNTSTSSLTSSSSGTSDMDGGDLLMERETQQVQEHQQLQQKKLEQQQQPQQQQQHALRDNHVSKQHHPPKAQAPLPPPLQQIHQNNQPSSTGNKQQQTLHVGNGLLKHNTAAVADQEATKQIRSRQHVSSVPPPPPPPLPRDESDGGSTSSTIKLSTFAGGKKPNMATTNSSTVASIVTSQPAVLLTQQPPRVTSSSQPALLPTQAPQRLMTSPPSPPACPTPDYDTMSLASEHHDTMRRPPIQNGVVNKMASHQIGVVNGKASVNSVNGNGGGGVGKNGSADCVEMESLESFKLTNPSTVRPKPPATYFAQNRKCASRSSDSSLNSRNSVQNVAVEGAKPTITIREYPTTLDRRNPSRFQFLNQNEGGGGPVVSISRDQPITSQLHSELTQTLSRVKLQSANAQESTQNGQLTNGTAKTNVVTICVNPNQKQQPSNNQQQTETNSCPNGGPFYLFPRKKEETPNQHYQPHQHQQRMVSTTLISKSDLQEVELRRTGAQIRYLESQPLTTRNSVTFNFGGSEKSEPNGARASGIGSVQAQTQQQPNGILKNGTANGNGNGNIAQVQIQNLNSAASNHSNNNSNRLPQQKSIKFGGITTIIRNSPEPKV